MTEYFPSQLEAESARITRIAHGMTDGQDANSYLNERVSQLKAELAETKELITSYQIAKDNLELRLANALGIARGTGTSYSAVPVSGGRVDLMTNPLQVY